MRNPFSRRSAEPEQIDLPPEVRERFEAIAQGIADGLASRGGAQVLTLPPKVPEAVQRERMLALAEAYGRCPFQVGQFVRKREGTMGHGCGWLHLVIEVAETPHRFFYLDSSATPSRDPDYGALLDMLVMHINRDGDAHAHWVESWMFEAEGEA